MNYRDLFDEIDAKVWVKHWMESSTDPTDEDAMFEWFDYALRTGSRHGKREEQQRDIREKLREIIFIAVGEASTPLLQDHPNYIFKLHRVVEAVELVCTQFGLPKGDD